ncbi:Uncharacterised protein [Mycobacterium tuberculosis]|nr:Uncharacterised protein [Mycobacterium tuberculosis]
MNLSSVRSLACTSVAERPCIEAKLGRLTPVRAASMWSARARRSLAGLTMTPTGTSTPKISCSRLANDSAESESPPRSAKCASGRTSAAVEPSNAAAARHSFGSTGASGPLCRSSRSSLDWLSASSV